MQIIIKNKSNKFRHIASTFGLLVKKHAQIKKIFCEDSGIFSKHIFNDNYIKWSTAFDGKIIQYSKCDDEQKEQVKFILKQQYQKLYDIPIIKEDEDYFEYLEKIIEIANYDTIYLIDNKVVLTNWSYIEDEYNAPRQIIKKLIENTIETVSEIENTKTNEPTKLDSIIMK